MPGPSGSASPACSMWTAPTWSSSTTSTRDDLRALRHRVMDLVFDEHAEGFRNLVAASKLLPRPLVGRIAERAFPAPLSAMICGLVSPGYAAELIRHVGIGYLADIAAVADPRKIAHIVPRLKGSLAAKVAAELAHRGDAMAAGLLVGLLDESVLPLVVAEFSDDELLLETALLVDHRPVLDEIVNDLDDDRLTRIARLAVERGLLSEWDTLRVHLSPANAGRVQRILGELSGP